MFEIYVDFGIYLLCIWVLLKYSDRFTSYKLQDTCTHVTRFVHGYMAQHPLARRSVSLCMPNRANLSGFNGRYARITRWLRDRCKPNTAFKSIRLFSAFLERWRIPLAAPQMPGKRYLSATARCNVLSRAWHRHLLKSVRILKPLSKLKSCSCASLSQSYHRSRL